MIIKDQVHPNTEYRWNREFRIDVYVHNIHVDTFFIGNTLIINEDAARKRIKEYQMQKRK